MDNWRTLGDTTLETYRTEFNRLGSPMLAEAEAIHAAAQPHSALALAIMFHEKKYDTVTDIIPAEFHNPLAVGKPQGGIGLDRWEQYPSYAAAVAAWKERVTSLTYKEGIYARTTTLAELVHIYAPSHDNNDEGRYHQVLRERLAAFPRMAQGGDEDRARGDHDARMGALGSFAPPVPVEGLMDFDPEDAGGFDAVRELDGTSYITVTGRVMAIRDTPRCQRAKATGARVGPDIKQGEQFEPAWIFRAGDGEWWYLTPFWTRVRVTDTRRVSERTNSG